MIINVCGTNGSGKSTVIRRWLERLEASGANVDPIYKEKRKRAIGYDIYWNGKQIHLVGAYDDDVATGGCDTITKIGELFKMLRELRETGGYDHIVYEGAIVMNMTQGPALVDSYPGEVHVLSLTTPLQTCVQGINQRRAAVGETALADPVNIKSNKVKADNYSARMRNAGATVIRVSREDAVDTLQDLIGS